MAGCHFAYGKQTFYIGLPPAVDSQSAVVVLRTESDFKRLSVQIHAFIPIEVDCRLVHVCQTFDWCTETGSRFFKINPCFWQQGLIIECSTHRICTVIQKNPAALAAFKVNQNINDRTSICHFANIKRPLIAFQKQFAEHIVDIVEEIHQKFFFVTAV